ncbi:flagellar motor switch protein FliN [Rhizobium oryzicola]|uniref:Flagellar motor switch protein FliN n=1 Tax=Rhizobium oryzicola TaxID=1232668 RepID=A0ABT8SRL4_9HYPH|nr:flagellar motor switch protein FliN [Rhizobium oryzicola]MDO1581001.1 flagellar motor switch protein FliN [Rhizobium oryzicola]
MVRKKTPLTEDDAFPAAGNEAELDQAIDDLRGVLKADADGGAPDFGAEFGAGSDFASEPSFGGGMDLGGDTSADLGGFGGDTDSFGGGSSFGGSSDFGGGLGDDFGGSSGMGHSVQEAGSALNANLDLIMDIPITVEIVLGTSRMQVSGLMELEEGAIIALDKKIGEPVEITVNGRRIAKGEITVLENDDTRFGVKLTEVLSSKKI